MAAGTVTGQRHEPAEPGDEAGGGGEPDVGGDQPLDRRLTVAARGDEVLLRGLDGGGERSDTPDPELDDLRHEPFPERCERGVVGHDSSVPDRPTAGSPSGNRLAAHGCACWGRAVVVDASLARRLVDRQFPQWASLPLVPVPVQGWDNRTFRLGDALNVRLPSAPSYAA